MNRIFTVVAAILMLLIAVLALISLSYIQGSWSLLAAIALFAVFGLLIVLSGTIKIQNSPQSLVQFTRGGAIGVGAVLVAIALYQQFTKGIPDWWLLVSLASPWIIILLVAILISIVHQQ